MCADLGVVGGPVTAGMEHHEGGIAIGHRSSAPGGAVLGSRRYDGQEAVFGPVEDGSSTVNQLAISCCERVDGRSC